jgi:hypothetical protein
MEMEELTMYQITELRDDSATVRRRKYIVFNGQELTTEENNLGFSNDPKGRMALAAELNGKNFDNVLNAVLTFWKYI